MGRRKKGQALQYRRVALMIRRPEYAYGRRKLQGIIDYYNHYCAWDIYRNEKGQPLVETPDELKGWDGDGIIGEIYGEKSARMIQSLGIPFVNTASTNIECGFPSVMLDNRLIGKMAAEHLIKRNLDQFAFIGPRWVWFIDERYEGFAETVKQSGGECTGLFYDAVEKTDGRIAQDIPDSEYLRRIIKKLPRPIGIMAAYDRVGCAVLETCRKLGIRVPEEVSLIGVDNDDSVFCQLAVPSMTSIDVSAEEIGFTAARMLDNLMAGRPLEEERVLVSSSQIVPRASTDMIRSEFPEVARALRFIRSNEHKFIDVSNVADVVPVSRRWLEMKFKDEVGHGIYHEIRRVHVERAKRLLETTDWPVSRVALESGFKTVVQFDDAFKKLLGMTGQEYRKSKARK